MGVMLISLRAKERQRLHGQTAPGKKKTLPVNLPEVFKGETSHKLATIAGVAHETIRKAKRICAKASKETKEKLRNPHIRMGVMNTCGKLATSVFAIPTSAWA